MRWNSTLALLLALTLLGCSHFTPVELRDSQRFSLAWTKTLYPLEIFPYRPYANATPLFVSSLEDERRGVLLFATQDRKVRAFESDSGDLLWEKETRGANQAQPVDLSLYDGSRDVLVLSTDGRIYRFSMEDGDLRWVSEELSEAGLTSQPGIAMDEAGGKVFVTTGDDKVVALSLKTGQVLWDISHGKDFILTSSGQAGIALSGDTLLTGFSDGKVLALDARNGSELWSEDLSAGAERFVDADLTPQALQLEDDQVFVFSALKAGLFALGLEDGIERWRYAGEGFSHVRVLDRNVYATRSDGMVVALDGKTGAALWETNLGTGWAGALALSRRYVFVSGKEALVVLSRSTGRPVMRWDDGYGVSAGLELAYGTLFMVANSGKAYALHFY